MNLSSAEKIFQVILVTSGAIGFIIGFLTESMQVWLNFLELLNQIKKRTQWCALAPGLPSRACSPFCPGRFFVPRLNSSIGPTSATRMMIASIHRGTSEIKASGSGHYFQILRGFKSTQTEQLQVHCYNTFPSPTCFSCLSNSVLGLTTLVLVYSSLWRQYLHKTDGHLLLFIFRIKFICKKNKIKKYVQSMLTTVRLLFEFHNHFCDLWNCLQMLGCVHWEIASVMVP